MVKLCAAEVVLRVCVVKVSELGFSVAMGPRPVPVSGAEPDRFAAPVAFTLAFRAPTVLGLKVIDMVQFALDANVVPHVVDEIANSAGSVVPMTTLVAEIFPLLVSVTFCAALVVPRFCPAKVRPATGVIVRVAPSPVPETGII